MSGNPSEISLYVLSAEALLNPFIFHKDLERVQQREEESKREAEGNKRPRTAQSIRSGSAAASKQ